MTPRTSLRTSPGNPFSMRRFLSRPQGRRTPFQWGSLRRRRAGRAVPNVSEAPPTTRVIAGVTEPRALADEALRALPRSLGGLAVRADLVGEVHAEWLRNHFRGQIVYSLRTRGGGGAYEGTEGARR